jgi:hypothetical protein
MLPVQNEHMLRIIDPRAFLTTAIDQLVQWFEFLQSQQIYLYGSFILPRDKVVPKTLWRKTLLKVEG